MFDKKLLDILACPSSKASLHYDEERQELICLASNLSYPIREGIPVLLEEEARHLSIEEKERYTKLFR